MSAAQNSTGHVSHVPRVSWTSTQSYLEPYDPHVRAGLGTSLLLESIFRQDNSDLSETASEEAHQLLLRARYHLNMAQFLSSVSPSTTAGAAADDAIFGNVGAISRKSSNVEGNKAATTAAVLHNLALAHIGEYTPTKRPRALLHRDARPFGISFPFFRQPLATTWTRFPSCCTPPGCAASIPMPPGRIGTPRTRCCGWPRRGRCRSERGRRGRQGKGSGGCRSSAQISTLGGRQGYSIVFLFGSTFCVEGVIVRWPDQRYCRRIGHFKMMGIKTLRIE